MKNVILWAIIILAVATVLVFIPWNRTEKVGQVDSKVYLASSPLGAVYVIDGNEIKLENGRAEREIVPDSASKEITAVFGEPVYGDIDNDGDDDVGLLLTQSTGGSGTFYYAAVALNVDGKYKGTNAILLGDRIAPQTSEIRNEVFTVNYAGRQKDEPMTARPSVGISKYLILEGDEVKDLGAFGEGEMFLEGDLVYGHEAHFFKPCQYEQEMWLLGTTTVLTQIKAEYEKRVIEAGKDPYTPIFVSLVGKIVPAPDDGFGADYERALNVRLLVRIPDGGGCR